MDRDEIIKKINNDDYKFDVGRLTSWIKCLPKTTHLLSPKSNKVGDVYMHPVFKHPYVILKKKHET